MPAIPRGSTPPKSKTPAAAGTGFSWHEELRKQKAELDARMLRAASMGRRGLSMPPKRSRQGCRLPVVPPVATRYPRSVIISMGTES